MNSFGPDRTPGGEIPTLEYEYVLGQESAAAEVHAQWAKTQRGPTHDREKYHSLEVRDTLYAMVGMGLPAEAYEAAVLHDFPSRVNDELRMVPAKRALGKYATLSGADKKSIGYLSAVLADFDRVETFGSEQRATYESEDEKFQRIIRGETKKADAVDPSYWLAEAPITDPKDMVEFLETITPAAVPIRAAELFQNIVEPSGNAPGELRDLYELESTLAPLMYWFGYDASAMTMNGVGRALRLQRANLGGFLHMAETDLEALGSDEEIITGIATLLGDLGSDFDHQPVIGEIPRVGPVLFSDIIQGLEGEVGEVTGGVIRGKLRKKSAGNAGFKKYRSGGAPLRDLVGLTMIPQGEQQVLAYYADIVGQLVAQDGSHGIELVSSATRTTPFSVKGDPRFYRAVLKATGLKKDAIDYREAPYSEAKITLLHEGRPVEIQVVTEIDRLNSKIGDATHVGQKTRKRDGISQPAPFDPVFMRRIKEFRSDMRSKNINPNSIIGAEHIATLLGRPIR